MPGVVGHVMLLAMNRCDIEQELQSHLREMDDEELLEMLAFVRQLRTPFPELNEETRSLLDELYAPGGELDLWGELASAERNRALR